MARASFGLTFSRGEDGLHVLLELSSSPTILILVISTVASHRRNTDEQIMISLVMVKWT